MKNAKISSVSEDHIPANPESSINYWEEEDKYAKQDYLIDKNVIIREELDRINDAIFKHFEELYKTSNKKPSLKRKKYQLAA